MNNKSCKMDMCSTKGNKKYDGYCLRCFMYIYPEKENFRNFRTKEQSVVNFVENNFSKLSWKKDRRIYDGCSKRRPDLFLDLGYQVLIIEVDENKHEKYDCLCENKRVMEMYTDLNFRSIILIRFNPDSYIKNKKKIISC